MHLSIIIEAFPAAVIIVYVPISVFLFGFFFKDTQKTGNT